jgi:hypothetical protein
MRLDWNTLAQATSLWRRLVIWCSERRQKRSGRLELFRRLGWNIFLLTLAPQRCDDVGEPLPLTRGFQRIVAVSCLDDRPGSFKRALKTNQIHR